MSQNGPYPGPPSHPWAGGEEPYTEPADPWGEHSEPSPLYAPPYGGTAPSVWGAPPPARRHNTPIVALVVVLGLLIAAGLGTAVWMLSRGSRPTAGSGAVAATTGPTTAANVPDPQPSTDARFVKKGDCVRNEGTAAAPAMTIAPCASGTYEVLKRIDGRTTGEADAESKCGKVPGYTKWYFYDSELDSLDFVLCLKER
jgi:hypothetical protein